MKLLPLERFLPGGDGGGGKGGGKGKGGKGGKGFGKGGKGGKGKGGKGKGGKDGGKGALALFVATQTRPAGRPNAFALRWQAKAARVVTSAPAGAARAAGAVSAKGEGSAPTRGLAPSLDAYNRGVFCCLCVRAACRVRLIAAVLCAETWAHAWGLLC